MRLAGGLCPQATRTDGAAQTRRCRSPGHVFAPSLRTRLSVSWSGFLAQKQRSEAAPSSTWPGLTLQMLLVVAPSPCSRISGAGPRSSGRCRYSCTSRSRQRWPRTLEETGVGAGAAGAGSRGQGYLRGTGRDGQGQEGQGAPPADGSPAPAASEGAASGHPSRDRARAPEPARGHRTCCPTAGCSPSGAPSPPRRSRHLRGSS